MAINRKEFLKKMCISGACLCGFGQMAFSNNEEVDSSSSNASATSGSPSANNDVEKPSVSEAWISLLLTSLNNELDEEAKRKVMKKTSLAHYQSLKMDELLAPYKGDLDKFIKFLNTEWGWKVTFDKSSNTLIADENKNYCVCPVSKFKKGDKTSAMCYCSEGFAEKMFSTVTGKPTLATVSSSVRRGDATCIYNIKIL